MIPNARKSDLVLQESGDDLLVYDLQTNSAICLNKTSALVWKKCDGVKSPWEIRNELEQDLGAEVSEDLVWFALDQLYRKKLLTNREDFTARYKGLSRRELIRKVGLASIVSLPIVTSLVAPLAVHAQSVCIPVMNGCSCDLTGMQGGGMGTLCTTFTGQPCASPGCMCVHANNGNNFMGNCVP